MAFEPVHAQQHELPGFELDRRVEQDLEPNDGGVQILRGCDDSRVMAGLRKDHGRDSAA